MSGAKIRSGRIKSWLAGKISLGRALKLKAADREVLCWRAHRAFEDGDLASAERLFALLDQFWPERVEGRLGRGVVAQSRGELGQAESLYGEVLTLDPRNRHALANRAEIRLMRGREAEAISDLSAADLSVKSKADPSGIDARIAQLRELAERSSIVSGTADPG